MTKILYIAGPMTGLPENNYPAFDDAESELTAWGYDVENPARSGDRHDAPRGATKTPAAQWSDYMRDALNQLIRADGIAVLPNWWASRGTRLEIHIAEQLNIKWMPLSSWILAAARERREQLAANDALIYGDEEPRYKSSPPDGTLEGHRAAPIYPLGKIEDKR